MAGMLRCCTLALLLPSLAHAQAGFAVERSTLPNGLDLLLHVDRKTPIVYVNIRMRTGSKHVSPGQYALAHLVEHLVYEDRPGNPMSPQLERLVPTTSCVARNEEFNDFFAMVSS